MKEVFVLDACSLIAFLADEPGASSVEDILHKARRNDCLIYMNIINVLEIYYGIYRCDGKAKADEEYGKIMDLPVIFLDKFDEKTIKEAGRFKATYVHKISYAPPLRLLQP